MEIKLDGDAVAELASAAIYQSLSETAREQVLQQAVQALLAPEKNQHSFTHGKSKLQQAYEQAINAAAFKAVQEHIANSPEVQARIDTLLGPLILGVVEEGAKNYDDGLATAIGNAIGSWLAERARG